MKTTTIAGGVCVCAGYIQRRYDSECALFNPNFGSIGSITACIGSVTGVCTPFCSPVRYDQAGCFAGDGRKVDVVQPALLALHPGRKSRRLCGGLGCRGRQYGHVGPQWLECLRYEAWRQGHRYGVARARGQAHRPDVERSIAKWPDADRWRWCAATRRLSTSRC